MTRARRVLMVLAASLLLLGIPGGFPASGQEEGQTILFGYTMDATATAISTLYDQPSFAIPATPTFEMRKVHSAATLDSGPSGRALGTPLWLGDVASNGKPSLLMDVLLFNPTQLDQLNEPLSNLKTELSTNTESFPAYPVRSETFYPPGGSDEDDLIMRSRVSDKESAGYATSGRLGVPAVISVGGLESTSSSRIFKTEAIAEMRSRVSDLDLFGIIHVDQIMTRARAISDGATGTTEGTLEITGFTITNPQNGSKTRLVYDKTGLHASRQNDPEEDPEEVARQDPVGTRAKALLENLAEQGITVTVGGVLEPIVEGALAKQAVSGLIVGLNAKGMGKLMKELPEQISTQLQNPAGGVLNPVFSEGGLLSPTVAGYLSTFFAGDQDVTLVFGSGAVQSGASPPLPVFDVPPVLPDVPLGPLAPPADLGGIGGGFVPPAAGGNGGGGTVFLNPRPVAVLGIPAGLLGLILFAAIAGAAGLRRVADIMTAPRAIGARCPLEEP